MKYSYYAFFCLTLLSLSAEAQVTHGNQTYSRADTLRGSLTSPYRTCYDINYYHLNVKVNPQEKFISGSNLFKFTATTNFTELQFDLFANLEIEKVIYHGKPLVFKREFNAVFLSFNEEIARGKQDSFTVYYFGKPTVAKRAPWDGGFIFAKTDTGEDWIATACQGVGASIWYPNKDQQADEVDSALISISVPNKIMDVSNGRLIGKTDLKNGYTRYDWKVTNPINNYNIAINATNYAHFKDRYKGLKGDLSLDYYVLPQNMAKAKKQFTDVKRLLTAFEYWFGAYPFYKDGYKLIETPHLGMEHQSGIAYGNGYKKGYLGTDLSGTGWGLKWDFIIVHESGHEWFGNNITAKDIADMWVHESFTNYSESLFTEYWYGKKAGAEYVIGSRKNILNDQPIIGNYGVNKEGSGDMYYKGANMLHTIRQIIDDDKKWRSIFIGLNQKFGKKTCTGDEIIEYFNLQTGLNLSPIFNQYLKFKNIPVLELRQTGNKVECRWLSNLAEFNMPLRLNNKQQTWINPSTEWSVIHNISDVKNVEIKKDFYIETKILNN
ncbi:M1 family metallopeptidase [Pedobacter arcticus]|uniref:M1 family metallopeptidase n=1 Tax=Pedobacter arcticus TaxID=752140 RepID=UPI0002DE51C8|nr:M1 family metallopeptidase [Pedobacter arcticus]